MTLFAAAALLGTASLAHADLNLDDTGSYSGDLVIGADYEITLQGTATLAGTLLSGSGSLHEQGILDNEGGTFLVEDFTLTISGGGTLLYEGGRGSGYYTETYRLLRGHGMGDSTIGAWVGMDSFWSSGAYLGNVTVGEGTTLVLEGQLTQYVALYAPESRAATNAATLANHGYAGVSSVTLESGATLSFAASAQNLMTSRPNLAASDPSADYLPEGKLALNFINNLDSAQDSKIIIGTDEESANRIVLHTDEGEKSKVGRLVGNGRFYTSGAGTVTFYGISDLDCGSNSDTSGNTWIQGNKIADIVLGNAVVNVGADNSGSDSVSVSNAVDNVFANATAVQLRHQGNNAVSGTAQADTPFAAEGVNGVNVGAVLVEGPAMPVIVNVYGNQVFNNFQSLWAERSALSYAQGTPADPGTPSGVTPTPWEPVRFSWTPSGTVLSRGDNSAVIVSGGSVLTINQDLGRDGYYNGLLMTNNASNNGEGLVVKTGAGRFYYVRNLGETGLNGTLTNLRIEEGELIMATGGLSGRVHLEDTGIFTILSPITTETISPFIQGYSADAVLNFVRSAFIENDLVLDSLTEAQAGNTSDLKYRTQTITSYRTGENSDPTATASIQIDKQQTQFFGQVVVNDGITLVLGEKSAESGKSIFSSASGITLNGDGPSESGLLQYSTLIINGTQIVQNLNGTMDKSKVEITANASLVLRNSSEKTSYTGGFYGEGNLIKFNENTQDVKGDLRGYLAVMSGSVSVSQNLTDVGMAGVILHNSTQATFTNGKVGTLVGTEGTGVGFSGDFVVGTTGDAPSEAFLKNPGELVYLSQADGTGKPKDCNGAFMQLYATTDATVFEQMQVASAIFTYGGATSVRDWLKAVFTEDAVSEFVSSDKSQLSESMAESLLAMAADIAGGAVDTYLDASGNLNAPGWNKLVAASGLEFLKWKFALDPTLSTLLDDSKYDSSLYGFITAFVGVENYQFILTESNAQLIANDYGVKSTGWFTYAGGAKTPNYDAFAASFGLDAVSAEKGEFAGTLSGTGNLRKVGSNTLKLTGVNTYTGKTIVDGGKLAVNWNSIQATSAVSVASGAELIITANKTDTYDAGDGVITPLGDSYGTVFNKDTVRLSGEGVVRKEGDGNVSLGYVLLDVAEGESDFTGTLDLYGGAVSVLLGAEARVATGDMPAFNVKFSGTSRFEMAFANSEDTTLEFAGKITDTAKTGTFTVDAGSSNTLEVVASKFAVNTVELKSGTMNIIGDGDLNIGTFKLGSASELAVTLKQDIKSSENIVPLTDGASGRLTVVSPDKNVDGDFIARKLSLNGSDLTGISSLGLVGGAQLVLSNLNMLSDTIELTELSAEDSASALTIGKNRVVSLTIGEGDVSTLAGTLHGSGKLIFNGATSKTEGVSDGTLIIGSENAKTGAVFGGEIEFNRGKISLVAGEGKTLDYSGLSITSSSLVSPEARTLTKEGAGTIKILAADSASKNSINGENLSIEVNAGELAVSGVVFSNGTLPDSLSIGNGAVFRLCDPFITGTNLDIADLGTLTGTGKLAFESSSTQTIDVKTFDPNAFSGIVEIGTNVTVDLASAVTEFSAFSGAGTLNVQAESLTIRVNSNADGLEKFTGNITGNLAQMTAVGSGTLVLQSIPANVTEISVGSATENGGVGVSADWTGVIKAQGAESRVFISGLDSSGTDTFEGKTEVGAGVQHLVFATDGTIALGNDALKKTFALSGGDGVAATLGNIAGTNLTLKNLNALGKTNENFELQTAQGGAIVFDGNSGTAIVRPLANVAPNTGVWSKDISGAGGIVLQDGAELTLTSSSLSYTGTTVVGAGTTLTYAAANGVPTVSNSSELRVDGGTVVGGVDLVGENSTVEFLAGSTFVFTGNAIRFTGTADVTGLGDITVKLTEDSLAVRGRPVALFEYVGAAGTEFGKNNISLSDISFVSSDVLYYVDADGTDAYTSGKTVIYIATDDLASVPGVKLHEGLDRKFIETLSEIATPFGGGLDATLTSAQAALAESVIKTPNGELAGMLNNLSPLSYGAMLALPQSGFVNDMAAISARIEQRRYDNYSSFIWETHRDWEFFAQAHGSFAESDEGESDTRTFDMNTYGAIAGMDVKLSAETVAGFAFSYDYGDADIHNNGGDIQSHDIRATAFFGKLIENRFYVDSGAQVGFAMYDIDRKTVLGSVDGDTTGWHAGLFTNVGMLVNLLASEDEKTYLNLMPYFGLAYSYYGVSGFDESGAATALDTDSFGASSLRASLGASLVLTTPCLGHSSRLNLDFAYTRELLDADADVDYSMPRMFTGKFKAEAKAFAEDTFSIGPRFSFDLDRNTSIYCGYRFDMSTDSDVSHSVNLGYRSRF